MLLCKFKASFGLQIVDINAFLHFFAFCAHIKTALLQNFALFLFCYYTALHLVFVKGEIYKFAKNLKNL